MNGSKRAVINQELIIELKLLSSSQLDQRAMSYKHYLFK